MSTSFILTDVHIFDGEAIIEQGYIHIHNGKIQSLGSGRLPSTIPFDTKLMSRPGHTVLPGFIDAHNHAARAEPLALRQALTFGVTTFMDMHNENHHTNALKAQSLAEPDLAASMKGAGIAATIENGWPIPVVTAHDKSAETAAEIALWPRLRTTEDAKAYVKENVNEGADFIKLMHESGTALGMHFTKPNLELQTALVDEAHTANRVAVAHALSLDDHMEMLACGINGMTHAFYDQPPTPEVIQAYKRNNAWLNPTLAAIGSLTTVGQAEAERFAHDPRVEGLLGEAERERMCQCMGFRAETSRVEYAYELVRQLHAAGVDIIVGSDAAKPALGTAWGLSFHHEISLLVNKCGLTPLQALRAGTSLTARRFGFTDRGRLAPGLNADLVLVRGRPFDDIGCTLDLVGVWREGVLARRFVEGEGKGTQVVHGEGVKEGGVNGVTEKMGKASLSVEVTSVHAEES